MAPTTPEPSAQARTVGTSVLRKEDGPLLTGRARFVDDLHREGMLHATILRSPHAHARIRGIDAAAARAHPGVAAVFTAANLPAGQRPIPMRMFSIPGLELCLQHPLASDVVRYSGDPVAVVVAESRYVGEDAAELIQVDYEPLAAVVDPVAALADGAPILHAARGSNAAATFTIERGEVDAAFAGADLIVEETVTCGRHAAVPLETRGLLAEVELASGRLTLWGAAKIIHVNKRILAALLDWPEERIRLVEVSVGGGFGARGEFYPEDFLIPWTAIQLGRPVAWTEDREENLRATNHSREQVHQVAMALRSDGTVLGLRDTVYNNTGAYVRTHGTVVPGMTAALLPGPYRWPAYHCTIHHVVTNKTPAGTYRAPGRYEATFVRERLLDIAARKLGRDPLDLRRQNLLPPESMPYEVGTHTEGHPIVFDSGDYPLLVDKAREEFDYEALLRWRDEPAAPGRRRGVGTALFVEKSGIGRWEYARVGLASDGSPVVHAGIASVGQGVQTVLAQICADHLGVPYEDITVIHGDTAEIADGMGAFGSRATMLAGAAVMEAAASLRESVLELGAELLEASPDDVTIDDRKVVVRGSPDAGISLRELAEAARPLPALRRGGAPGLSEESYFHSEDMSFPYGLHIAAVEVDVETGGVDVQRYAIAYDVGKAINPKLIHGQIVGGLAQGLGGALFEELAYDDQGQLVAGSFMDYLLPTAGEVPRVDVLVTEDAPTPLTPLGAKGAGEGGTTAAGAAIANAVSNALGADAFALPLTPERVVDLAAAGSAAG